MKGKKTTPTASTEEPKTKKPISLPDRLWEILEKDSARCRRTITKHIEAIIVMHYGLDDVDMNKSEIEKSSE